MERKRSLSSSGWLRLAVSSSTRMLKASQETSRLMKRSLAVTSSDSGGSTSSGPASASAGVGAATEPPDGACSALSPCSVLCPCSLLWLSGGSGFTVFGASETGSCRGVVLIVSLDWEGGPEPAEKPFIVVVYVKHMTES